MPVGRWLVPLPGEAPAGYPRAWAEPDGGLILSAGDKRLYRVSADLAEVRPLSVLPVRQGGRAVPFRLGGRLLAVANDNLEHPVDGQPRDHAVRLFESPDGGVGWSLLSTIVETGAQGCYEPQPLVLPTGELLIAYSREHPHPTNPAYQVCELRRSADGGRTWGPLVTIAADDRSRDGMPVLCRLADGRLLAVFESTDAGYFQIRAAVSSDAGHTWHGRAMVDDPGPGGYSGAPFAALTSGGRAVVSFQTKRWSADEDIALCTSDDGGASWGAAEPVFAGPGRQLWASLCPTPSGLLLLAGGPGEAGPHGVQAIRLESADR